MIRKEVLEILGGAKALASQDQAPNRPIGIAAGVAEKAAAYASGDRAATRRKKRQASWLAGFDVVPLRVRAVEAIARRLEVPMDDILAVLGITGRTAQRRRQEGVLSADESDRLYRLARIMRHAAEVFGSEQIAGRWLKSEMTLFEGASPLALLGSDAGTQEVEKQLGRIEYGDLY